jgi:hypothetical protein
MYIKIGHHHFDIFISIYQLQQYAAQFLSLTLFLLPHKSSVQQPSLLILANNYS